MIGSRARGANDSGVCHVESFIVMAVRQNSPNRVLRALSPEDQDLIEPFLETVELPFRRRLQSEHRPIEHAYFPYDGLASVVAVSRSGRRQSEVGLVGRDGMTGASLAFAPVRSPYDVFMQVAGAGRRISAKDLWSVGEKSPSLRITMWKSAHCFSVQIAHTAMANAEGRLEERLARWLLMGHDRLDGDELHLTHEFLALMLGVRRAGVTIALQHLSSRGLIDNQRGSVTITDREGLEDSANGIYGAPEIECEHVFPEP